MPKMRVYSLMKLRKLRNDFEKNKDKYKKDLEKYIKPSNQSESSTIRGVSY